MSAHRARFWFGAIYLAVVPVAVGIIFDAGKIALIAAVCGAVIMLMAQPENLAELSMGPLRAKMRREIEEASATIQQLRDIAAISARVQLSGLMASTFLGGMTLRERFSLRDEIVESLRSIGASDSQIQRALETWNGGVRVLYHNVIRRSLAERGKELSSDAEKRRINVAMEALQNGLDFKLWKPLSPSEMEQVLRSQDMLNPATEAWLQDYRRFVESGDVPRRAVLIDATDEHRS